eukprot:1152079-Pelagomonas_calceolata.AAC.21
MTTIQCGSIHDSPRCACFVDCRLTSSSPSTPSALPPIPEGPEGQQVAQLEQIGGAEGMHALQHLMALFDAPSLPQLQRPSPDTGRAPLLNQIVWESLLIAHDNTHDCMTAGWATKCALLHCTLCCLLVRPVKPGKGVLVLFLVLLLCCALC